MPSTTAAVAARKLAATDVLDGKAARREANGLPYPGQAVPGDGTHPLPGIIGCGAGSGGRG